MAKNTYSQSETSQNLKLQSLRNDSYLSFLGEMIISNNKYLMTEVSHSYYSVQMKLIIRRFEKSDLGGYKCISKNSIGDAEGTIRVYGEYICEIHIFFNLVYTYE